MHEKRYTKDELDQIDADFHYMLHGQGFTFLMVDPNHTFRRTFVNKLRTVGIDEVREAKSAGEAVIEARKIRGDIVFLVELNMPGKDGIALTKELHANEAWKDSKVILFSDETKKERLVQALRCGAHAFLKKPVTPEGIVTKLQEFGYRCVRPSQAHG